MTIEKRTIFYAVIITVFFIHGLWNIDLITGACLTECKHPEVFEFQLHTLTMKFDLNTVYHIGLIEIIITFIAMVGLLTEYNLRQGAIQDD